MSQSWIVLPAYNEAAVIGSVIQDIHQHGFSHVIAVDDGSTDATGSVAQAAGAMLVTHRLNRGKGAATKTGLEAARLLKAGVIVTMDADGQHQAKDIPALIAPIIAGRCEVALGTRRWESNAIPRAKTWQNAAANAATWLLYRKLVTDSQSGFRAYSRRAAGKIDPQADFYNFDSEVIREIRRLALSYAEVPIDVRYTAYSQSKPARQSVVNGARTAARMLWELVS